jgi:GT2 family glycosyltransferase
MRSVSAVIPAWGDLSFLASSIPPLLASTGVELEVIIVNNDPAADVRSYLDAHVPHAVTVIETGFNAGFPAAVNRGFASASGEFVFVSNPDLIVSPTYLATLVGLFERRPEAGLATGKIRRYDFPAGKPTEILDSAGLVIGRNRRARDRGEGLRDAHQFEDEQEVFGVSGAALVGRRTALAQAAIEGELMDESFYMYKEDVDLSWRVRLFGWQCWYVPSALAYHGRTSRGAGASYAAEPLAFVRAERAKPLYVRAHSMKNQWLMLVKNEDLANLRRDFLHVAARELTVLVHNLLLAPRTFKVLPAFVRALPDALAKRRAVQAGRRVSPAEIRRWWDA